LVSSSLFFTQDEIFLLYRYTVTIRKKRSEVSATRPTRLIPYKIIRPYFGPKNAKIIDPTFFPSHTVYIYMYVYMSEVGGSLLSRMVKTMVKQMVDERFVEL
jgi:hypothetical protein